MTQFLISSKKSLNFCLTLVTFGFYPPLDPVQTLTDNFFFLAPQWKDCLDLCLSKTRAGNHML